MVINKLFGNIVNGASVGLGAMTSLCTMQYIIDKEHIQSLSEELADVIIPEKILNTDIHDNGSVFGSVISIIVIMGFSKLYYDMNNERI
tara:strand:+ start:212 stop:478 length:267 start_codon:yes stop_codon:yes gene_type:complete